MTKENTYVYGLLLVIITALSLVLRLLYLGNTFQSSDNAALAAMILKFPGFSWINQHPYGVIIAFLGKVFSGIITMLGVKLTEFWWKFPVAVIGSLQPLLTYWFIVKTGFKKEIALLTALMIVILPIHVMQSRYLWGYEVLGVFFITLALFSLYSFFKKPNLRNGLISSFFIGLYLLSHGYTLPFVACLVFCSPLLIESNNKSYVKKWKMTMKLFINNFLWIFPLFFFSLYKASWSHGLSKNTILGFYIFDHGLGFIQNCGFLLTFLILFSLVAINRWKKFRSKWTLFLIASSCWYLMPIFFLTPPGITLARGYMLTGTYLLLIASIIIFSDLLKEKKALRFLIFSFIMLFTLSGDIDAVFFRGKLHNPDFIKIERGEVGVDPGTKTAGYFVQKYISSKKTILAVHRSIEPPNLYYYFDRDLYSFYDLSLVQTLDKIKRFKNKVDIVICDKDQLEFIKKTTDFRIQLVIYSENKPRIWILGKKDLLFPIVKADTEDYNKLFDKIFSPKVNFF